MLITIKTPKPIHDLYSKNDKMTLGPIDKCKPTISWYENMTHLDPNQTEESRV